MVAFQVSPFSRDYAEAVRELDCRCFSVPIPESLLSELPEKDNMSFFILLNHEGILSGYAGMMFILDEAEVISIAVDEQFRGLGGGALLMEAMLEDCERRSIACLSLEVREGNVPAQKLYRKFGFALEGVRKNYYSNPKENALIMTRRMKQR